MKRDDWAFGEKNFIIEDIDDWRRSTITDRDAESAEKKRLDIDYKYEQARLTKIKADILEGKYMDRVDHNRVLVAVVNLIRKKLEEWVEGLPPQIGQMKPVEIREIIRDRYDQLCVDMHAVAFVAPASDREVEDMLSEKKLKPRPGAGRPKKGKRK